MLSSPIGDFLIEFIKVQEISKVDSLIISVNVVRL